LLLSAVTLTNQQFRQALDNRSPGIMDERSVAYWDLVLPKSRCHRNCTLW